MHASEEGGTQVVDAVAGLGQVLEELPRRHHGRGIEHDLKARLQPPPLLVPVTPDLHPAPSATRLVRVRRPRRRIPPRPKTSTAHRWRTGRHHATRPW